MRTMELFRRFRNAEKLPHVPLATIPTPVAHFPELGLKTGLPDLWVKHDDRSGLIYGGNKVRKLEFVFGDALAQGQTRVWTVGAVGSHHVLATSLYARKLGLTPEALHFPQPITPHVREVLAALSTTQPGLELLSSKNGLPGAMIKTRIKEWLSRAENPYYIPGGGSSPEGVLGYVNAAMELACQIEENQMPMPDAIFVAAGTCGTLAGLILGAKMIHLPVKIIGVRVVDKVISNPIITASLANRAGKLLQAVGVKVPKIQARDVMMIDDQIGEGYGFPTAAAEQAKRAADNDGHLELDSTYTAKAFAGMVAYHQAAPGGLTCPLYWHTLSSVDLSPLLEHADPKNNLPPKYQEFLS